MAWDTYVYNAKASEIDNKQKWKNQEKMYSKHYTHKSSKGIKTFQMSYYVYIHCSNDLQIVKVQKGK